MDGVQGNDEHLRRDRSDHSLSRARLSSQTLRAFMAKRYSFILGSTASDDEMLDEREVDW